MRREPPDSRFYGEIRDLNQAFLELVAAGRHYRRGSVFGLDRAIVDAIDRMNPAQLAEMAATPCLLAGYTGLQQHRLQRLVAEPPPAIEAEWTAQATVYATGLLTYIWQMARRDPLRAALCAGPAAEALAGELRFGDIRVLATRALQHVEARFVGGCRFWPDLVRAARDGQPERIRLARLTAIQLATSEAGRRPDVHSMPFDPRLVSASAGRN